MTDAQLMQKIREQWGAAIDEALADSDIPAAFIAALIANETGGNPMATRFESGVYENLKKKFPQWNEKKIENNATSWGLTQIMGVNYPGPPAELQNPATSLKQTVYLVHDFARVYMLDEKKEFEKLFRCWNSGHPTGQTFDPSYVQNGMVRMGLYPATSTG